MNTRICSNCGNGTGLSERTEETYCRICNELVEVVEIPSSVYIDDLRCPYCKDVGNLELFSFGIATKWDTVKHGIEAYCHYCDKPFTVVEKEN